MRIIELKVMISCFLIAHDEKALSLSLSLYLIVHRRHFS